jgi:hypothetical protein
MKEKPILFSGPMVRAILDGQKTQTRRIVKGIDQAWGHRCPKGAPGDRLWVKETHYKYGHWVKNGKTDKGRQKWKFVPTRDDVRYWDTAPMVIMRNSDRRHGWYKRPSLFMRRVDSRILLEIADTRVERLNDIGNADCKAEGCAGGHGSIPGYGYSATPREHFNWLWKSINGPGSWDDNPYAWAISFKRVE